MGKIGFLPGLGIVTLLAAVLSGGLWLVRPEWVHPHTPYIIVYCVALTFLTYRITAAKAGTRDFANAVLAATGIRLFLSAVALVLYILLIKEDALRFVLTFFILYFLFVGFEIKILLHTLRRKTH